MKLTTAFNRAVFGILRTMKKKLTRGALVKKLDAAFSQYIRIKDARMGDATCVTCGVTRPWKELQNGHFYTRGRYPTRWDETNCHVQCMRCNVMLKGNYIPYTKYMIDRYGREYVDELERISLTPSKIPTATLAELVEHYKLAVQQYERGEVVTPLDKSHPWGV